MKREVAIVGVLLMGAALALAADGPQIEMRPLYHSPEFDPGQNATFCLEDVEDLNGLTEAQWDVVRQELIRGMKAKGYRYLRDGGILRLQFGAFPPNDTAHPVVGLYLKLRVGTRLQDLPKWTLGAMAHGDYNEHTMQALAAKLVAEVPECRAAARKGESR